MWLRAIGVTSVIVWDLLVLAVAVWIVADAAQRIVDGCGVDPPVVMSQQ